MKMSQVSDLRADDYVGVAAQCSSKVFVSHEKNGSTIFDHCGQGRNDDRVNGLFACLGIRSGCIKMS